MTPQEHLNTTVSHLKIAASDRGFVSLPPVPGAYGGSARAYESSGAEAPRLWLAVNVPISLRNPERGYQESIIHLEAEDAWHLAEQLMTLVQNHYQGDSRPVLHERVYDQRKVEVGDG